jgi:hypothetical protein
MYHYPDSHSTDSPDHLAAVNWIIWGLLLVIAFFIVLMQFIPRGW